MIRGRGGGREGWVKTPPIPILVICHRMAGARCQGTSLQRTFSQSSIRSSVGIRDILVRIRYLWLVDPDPAPDPTPTFFIDFKDTKKIFFHIFFIVTCAQTKKFNYLLKFCVKILFCRHYFSPINTFMRKKKDPEPEPYIWLIDPDPDLEGPKTSGSGSPNTV